MNEDFDKPTKIRHITPAKPKYGFPTDELCDENYPPHDYEQAEAATRKVLLELCERHLNRELCYDEIIKLPLPVSGHSHIKVTGLHGQSFHWSLEGSRREILTSGLTVKLGDMENGEFKPSDYSYVAYPPHTDDIIANYKKKSVFFKVL